MVKLPKYLIQTLLSFCLIISLFHLYSIYKNDEIIIFKYYNSFFLSILIGSLFLLIHQKDYGDDKKNFLNSPYLTAPIIVIEIFVLSMFIRQITLFGVHKNEILYWQISAPILAILSLIALVKIHLHNINKKDKPTLH